MGKPRENGPMAAISGIGPEYGIRGRFTGLAAGKPAQSAWLVTVPGRTALEEAARVSPRS